MASPQVPDYIIYKQDTIRTYNLLVEKFLQNRKQDEGQLFGLSFRNSIEGSLGSSLNCWRGYQAIYKVENDSLFVSDIIDCHSIKDYDKQASQRYLNEIFGDRVKNKRVHIDWFSGNISFPINSNDNKILRWDGVFENIFLFETVLRIENGLIDQVIDIENYTDLEKGSDRINRDSISNILFRKVKDYKWKRLKKIDCSENYLITIGKNGKVSKVIIPDYQTNEEIAKYWDTESEYKHCIESMKRALKDLQFDIIKRKGEPLQEEVFIEIWFEEDGIIENWTN